MQPIQIGKCTFFVLVVKPTPEMLSTYSIFWILYATEFAALCFALTAIPNLVRSLERTPLFHRNLVRITQAYFLFFYAGFLSRMIIFLHQVNVLDVKASSIHAGFLVAAAVVRMSFTNFLGLFLPSLIVERVFASKFINDYEKLSRSWISKIILFITTTIAIFFSVTVALGFYTVSSIAITTCIIHIVYVFVYIYLFRKNYVELRDINQGIYQQNIRYTLSIKFQLTENQRVMKTLLYISIVIATSAVMICVFLYLSGSVFSKTSAESQVCFELLEVSLAICYDIIIVIFMAIIGIIRINSTFLKCFKKTEIDLRQYEENRKIAQLYFDYLSNSWNISEHHRLKK